MVRRAEMRNIWKNRQSYIWQNQYYCDQPDSERAGRRLQAMHGSMVLGMSNVAAKETKEPTLEPLLNAAVLAWLGENQIS